ncbi:MFS general substrate transporter [Pseudovirgaria hyperparasitica]|uniref:MFS general substrate transporter n=1 Tax=Pseudovirgaria hyperparasitica TaxID=470096 RepID=A0A6A6W2R7_9PEZI|nr:MFS general substrate transporter [Pseudovirgaria hyperparasitica]KAF2756883.1 MFS general substrate transporter [Pseudovirgaria hyperparasitica]
MRTSSLEPSKHVISFADDSPEEPNNWSRFWKLYSIATSIMTVLNSTVASSLGSGVSHQLSEHFAITNEEELVLPTSVYIFGYVLGSIVSGPVSEQYGRKITMIGAFFIFTVFSIGCTFAPNWPAFIIFRFFIGCAGACPISVVSGICADVYHNPKSRGRALALYMVATCWGPTLGPVFSGYLATVSWRWPWGLGALIAGATWPFLLVYKETYSPVLLRWKAARLRKEKNDPSIVAPSELEDNTLYHVLTVVLSRSVRMLFTEPLVFFTSLYLSLVYALFYIFLESYPIIYGGVYGLSPGKTGLMFITIGIGAYIACPMYLWWDYFLEKNQRAGKKWALNEEYRRLPLACAAGPFLVASLFWSGFTAKSDIHWAVPASSGISFGIGYLLLFMAMLNYLVDAYRVYAASASAAAAGSRSLLGAVLPFAAKPMYDDLGIQWATGTLGFICAVIALVPFSFIVFGPKMRARSPFCQFLKAQDEKDQERREKTALEGKDEEAPGEVEK